MSLINVLLTGWGNGSWQDSVSRETPACREDPVWRAMWGHTHIIPTQTHMDSFQSSCLRFLEILNFGKATQLKATQLKATLKVFVQVKHVINCVLNAQIFTGRGLNTKQAWTPVSWIFPLGDKCCYHLADRSCIHSKPCSSWWGFQVWYQSVYSETRWTIRKSSAHYSAAFDSIYNGIQWIHIFQTIVLPRILTNQHNYWNF